MLTLRSTRTTLAALALAALGASACKEEKKPEPPAPPTPAVSVAPAASAAPEAKTAAAPGSHTDAGAAGRMTHCPSTAPGAKTEIKDIAGGVEVKVTGEGVAEIRKRAKFHADEAKNASPDVQHTGTGEGGGTFGRCPVVMARTNVDAKDVEGGAVLTVTAKDPKEVDWLRREARDRARDLDKPGATEAGQKHMANCPSAVGGAKTAVKATKDAVLVSVTATSGDATADIRARAKKIVEAAKVSSTAVAHTGTGTGGGDFGRCPLVLDETDVSAKEIPGGVELTVKPKKADALAKVKKEIEERSKAF